MIFCEISEVSMRILYRQSANFGKGECLLSRYGINKCYFKSIKQSAGDGNDAKKRHSHTGYEFHIMIDGKQCYETDGGIFELDSGKILPCLRVCRIPCCPARLI